MLTFQTASVLGVANVVEKLKVRHYRHFSSQNCQAFIDVRHDINLTLFPHSQSLPFQRIKHVPQEIDAQPSFNNGVLVLVTGQLQVDDEERPMNFTQVFQLAQDEAGQYYVHNDVFKLIFG